METNFLHPIITRRIAALVLGIFAITSFGATKYWDTDAAAGLQGGNGTWDAGATASWSTSTDGSNPLMTWQGGDDAEFRATGVVSYTNTISGSVEVNSINKGNNNRVVLRGGTLRLGAGGLRNDEAGEQKALVVESPVVLTADQAWYVKWSSPSILRVSGDISEAVPGTTLTLSRSAGGAGGRFELSGTGSYSGGTLLEGTNTVVVVSNADAFGTGPVTFAGGQLVNNTAMVITNDLVFGPDSVASLTTGNIDFSRANLTLSGDLSGPGLLRIKNVSNWNKLELSGNNSGLHGHVMTVVNGEWLFASAASGSPNAEWEHNGNAIRLGYGGGDIHFGALSGGITWSKLMTVNDNQSYKVVIGEKNIDSVYAGMIEQAFAGTSIAIEKRGTGTFALTNPNHSFRGGVTILDGTFQATTLANDWVNCSVGKTGPLVLDGGTLQYAGAGDSSNRRLTLGLNGGTLDASGTAPLVMVNTSMILPTGGARTFTLAGSNTETNTLRAVIPNDGANATSLSKKGPGTWVTMGANTYTGATDVEDGLLLVDGSLAAGSAVSVHSTGALGGVGTVNGTLTAINGGQVAGGKNGSGTLSVKNLAVGTGGAIALTAKGDGLNGLVRVPADGSINLQDFNVAVNNVDGYAINAPGIRFGLVKNETADPISTTGLTYQEGDLVYKGQDSYGLRVTYSGNITETGTTLSGTGNDIVLYSVVVKEATMVIIR